MLSSDYLSFTKLRKRLVVAVRTSVSNGTEIVRCLCLDLVVDTKLGMTDEKVSGEKLAIVICLMARFWLSANVLSALVKLRYARAGSINLSIYSDVDSHDFRMHQDACLFNLANRLIVLVAESFATVLNTS